MDEEALENEDINQAFKTLKELSADDKVRYEAEALENGRLSAISAKNAELREALKEELARVEEEKREIIEKTEAEKREQQLQNAKKMLSDGLTVEMTAKYSGLTIDEVKEIR